MSHSARRSARARPSSVSSTSTGITPVSTDTPSLSASSTSCSAAVMPERGSSEVRVTVAPVRAAATATSWATKPCTTISGRSLGLIRLMRPSRRATETTSIEVSPPPTHTTRSAATWSRPVLNASRNFTPLTQFGASPPGTGSGRPLWHPIVHRTASCSASISSKLTSRPTHVESRVSMPPRARMRSISLSRNCRGVR